MKFLSVFIHDKMYGLRLDHVVEIGHVKEMTEYTPPGSALRGVINLRNQIIPILELSPMIGMQEKDYKQYQKIVFVKPKMHTDILDPIVGLLVDGVGPIESIEEEEITTIPLTQNAPHPSMTLFKKKDALMSLVDTDALLVEELKNLETERMTGLNAK